MTKYAENTSVPADRSRGQIEQVLQRYGADQFMYGWNEENAVVQFRAEGRLIRFVLPMPDKDDPEFTLTPTGRDRSATQALSAWEQSTRQRWRALLLVIKAKLEAVESGITEFESEFLGHVVLPDNTVVADWIRPQIEHAYETGEMPKTIPALTAGSG